MFSKIFFILIVSFLCQSDLMNIIQDKRFFSSFSRLKRFQYWVIAVLPPADYVCFFVYYFYFAVANSFLNFCNAIDCCPVSVAYSFV